MNGVSRIHITEDITLVTFRKVSAAPALTAKIFNAFANAGINIDMISQTAPYGNSVDFSFTLPSVQLAQVLTLIGRLREDYEEMSPMVSSGNCKIQLYGEEMRTMHGVAAAAIQAVSQTGAELSLITTSEVDISLLVSHAHCGQAAQALEKIFSVTAVYA